MTIAFIFTQIFLFVLFANIGLKLWLSLRQARHVAIKRSAVPKDFEQTITLLEHQKAADYTIAKLRIGRIDLMLGAVIVLGLTLGGGLSRLSLAWEQIWSVQSIWHGVALLVSITVLTTLLELPLGIYSTFKVEKEFGFNRMTWRLFIQDLIKSTLLGALLGFPLLTAFLWLMQSAGAFWWILAWAFWLSINLGAMVIWPIFIAPLFNKFKPLEDAALKMRIDALLQRCGFKSKGLFVMDGSRRSAHGNAYFTGLGAAKRIVFYDTLLEALTPQEIEAVLAHELGHFHHKHLWKRLLILAPTSLLFLAFLAYLLEQTWFFSGLGLSNNSTAAGLALFSMVLPLFLFPFTPIFSHSSRKHEFQADAYAARHANAQDLCSALVKLYKDNASTLTPDPLYTKFYASHPPAATRLAHLQKLAS